MSRSINGQLSSMNLEEKYWKKVDKRGEEDCWIWIGAKGRYGHFRVGDSMIGAHRFAWYLHHKEWPSSSLYICHSCDNELCVNPKHLWSGTGLDNQQDCIAKGRKNYAQPRKLTDDQVRMIRNWPDDQQLKPLAKKLGVSWPVVWKVYHYQTYKDVT